MKTKVKEWMQTLNEEVTVSKREMTLGVVTCVLAGMVVGILAAKAATGWSINIASNNCSNNKNEGEISDVATASDDEKKAKKKNKKKERE